MHSGPGSVTFRLAISCPSHAIALDSSRILFGACGVRPPHRQCRKELIDRMSDNIAREPIKTELENFERVCTLFVEIASRHRTKLLRRADRIPACREDAEDIVQEALLKALRGLPHFRGDSRMETWLYSIMSNAILEHLRNRKNRIVGQQPFIGSEDDEETIFEIPDLRPNPEESCADAEMERLLLSEIDKLDSVCRLTLRACLLENIPYQTVAESLCIGVSAVKSRVFRGRRMLQKVFFESCVENSIHHSPAVSSEDL